MKIDDIAKQLANKVNQEHYIRHYLEKVQRGAYNKGFKDAEAMQLTLTDVSQQRELLHTKVFKLANELAINGYGNEAVKMHQICNSM